MVTRGALEVANWFKDAFLSLFLSSSKTWFLVVENLATSLIFLKCFTQAAYTASNDSRNIRKKMYVVLYLVQLKFCYSINLILMLGTRVQAHEVAVLAVSTNMP